MSKLLSMIEPAVPASRRRLILLVTIAGLAVVQSPPTSLGGSTGGQHSSGLVLSAAPLQDSGQRNIRPIRTVQDPFPTFAGIAVDSVNDEVVVSDENRFSLIVYDRTLDVPGIAEPRRRITGHNTKLEFICGVAVDPQTREIFTVNNDTMDNLLVFGPDDRGNATPRRELKVDHGAWGVSLDLENDEIAITTQHINKVSIYRKNAQGEEAALRFVQGDRTELADPHGVFLDSKNEEMIVSNHGSWRSVETGGNASWYVAGDAQKPLITSTGKYNLPSLNVYSRTAEGDAAPIRKIQGPNTRLSLPSGIHADTIHDEIAVANDGGNSILIFSREANGDVSPIRVIKGPATGLKNPSGVWIDTENDELWVSNWGDHSANVYPRTANGDVAPVRTIRSAPRGVPMPGMGNPGAVAYDPTRQQILVPN